VIPYLLAVTRNKLSFNLIRFFATPFFFQNRVPMKIKILVLCLVLILVITRCNSYEKVQKTPQKHEQKNTLAATARSGNVTGVYDNTVLSHQPVAFWNGLSIPATGVVIREAWGQPDVLDFDSLDEAGDVLIPSP
jgi:hypothetical protein